MKLPAIAIAAFFAAGIVIGLTPAIAQRAGSHTFFAFLFAVCVTSLLVGILLATFAAVPLRALIVPRRISDLSRGEFVSSAVQFAGDAVVVANAGTAACCRMVRPISPAQLSPTSTVGVAHRLFPDHAGVVGDLSPCPIFASRDCHAKFVRSAGMRDGADCDVSLCRADIRGQAGSFDTGCGTRGFVVRGIAGRQDATDRRSGAFGKFPGHEQARGVDLGEEAVSPYLWGTRFQKIDVVALTHAHQDHLGGLNAILENFRVARLWIGREVKSPALAKLESLAKEKNIPVEYESRNKGFALDGVEGNFLWPEVSDADAVVTAKNNDSLVLRLKYRNRTLLLPGDAEKQAEQAMLTENSEEDLRADVLKVGHHGSKNSTKQEFLEAVRPRVAIISAGEDNPYGHPSPDLLERLQTAGVRVLRADRDGAVHILTDGDELEISCFVACGEPAVTTISGSAQAPDQNQNSEQ